MNEKRQQRYQPAEFARLTGVTVRALHHYDRLGLLKPSGRSALGHRSYGPADFARLQQIVTLKFIGFSLKEIRRLQGGADLRLALRAQRASLEEKRRQLNRAIEAITKAVEATPSRRADDWKLFSNIIQRIQMQSNQDWSKKYYSEEAQKALAERGKLWNPEMQKQIEQDWTQLFDDVKAAIKAKIAPESQEGQALAARWDKLIEAFTGGNAGLREGAKKVWQDFENLPAEQKANMQSHKNMMSPEVCAFYAKAKAAKDAGA